MNIIEKLLNVDPFFGAVLVFFTIIILLLFYLLNRLQLITVLKNNIRHLSVSLQELDKQTKLIIKGDMELKLYQEEIEDKLVKLSLLKTLITSSVHILDKTELFSQFDEKLITDIGFKKGVILSYDDVTPQVTIGFSPEEIEKIQHFVATKKHLLLSTTLLTAQSEPGKQLAGDIGTNALFAAPLRVHTQIHAILLLAQHKNAVKPQQAEKELFSILCAYLGQCLENIKLFEELYHVKDDLEKKIKERTNELVKSLREIEVVSKTKSDFISSVSHELRTPLTSVKGFSSLLVDEKFGKLPPEAKARLEKIDTNVDKLVAMVNMLLDISRIESGKTEVKICPADIAQLIRDVGDFLSPQVQKKKLTLTITAPQEVPVYMDKNLIERVLINLVNNAIKFTPEGGTITLRCAPQGNHTIVSVSDTGCGMPEEDLDKVFQEFYRTRLTQGIQGSGLGLSLVKRILDTHSSKIWVESKVGEGTTFHFSLKTESHVSM